jgi:hypothetical protein
MARRSLDLIEAMYAAAAAAQPITGRGVGYKLFAASLISRTKKTPPPIVEARYERDGEILESYEREQLDAVP